MSDTPGFDFLRFRDGTSRQQRTAGALDPDVFALDERSLWDLLKFAQRYAGTLRYFNQHNEVAGDWSGFLEGDKDTLNEMVAYLKDPAYFDRQPEKRERYSRPHLALFLTFLSLLQEAQVQMNQVTRRQLDFYYKQALLLHRREGRPDRVHLLARPEPETDQTLIPKGTLLFAGEDAEGDPILYRTDAELLANQARIARISSLHVDKEVQSLAGIREFERDTARPEEAFIKELALVYRLPGTENTPRPYPEERPTDRLLDKTLISDLDALASFVKDHLRLPRVTSFQYLMELYRAWENPLNWRREGKDAPDAKGGGINDYLIRAAKRKNATFDPSRLSDIKDFEANVKTALGVDVAGNKTGEDNLFKDLEGVEDVYDLYFAYLLLKNSDNPLGSNHPVLLAVNALGFDPKEEFEGMMKLRMDTLEYLKEIIRILSENVPVDQPFPADSRLITEVRNKLDTLKARGRLHLYYLKDATFSNLVQYICKLPGSVMDFPGWDRELLTIIAPSNTDLKTVMENWEKQAQKGGFYIEMNGDPEKSLPNQTVNQKRLDEERSIRLPTDRPGCYLKVSYTGNSLGRPKVSIKTDKDLTLPVKFDPASMPGALNIALKAGRIPVDDLIREWNNLPPATNKGGFALEAVTPGLKAPVAQQKLNHEFALRIPADKLQNYLQIGYNGQETPELVIALDETQADPVRFELPAEPKADERLPDRFKRLIIRIRNEKTPSAAVLSAWKKVNQKRGFFMEFTGEGSTGITTTDPLRPALLNRVFSARLPADSSENYLKITYAGLAPTPGAPTVVIEPAAVGSVAGGIAIGPGVSAAQLSIRLAEDKDIAALLESWKNLTPAQRAGFDLEPVGPSAGSTNIAKPVANSTITLNKAYSLQLETTEPGVFLKVNYPGILRGAGSTEPKIIIITGGSDLVSFSTSASLLRISQKENNTQVHKILEVWRSRTTPEKRGYALEFVRPILSESEAELDQFFSAGVPSAETGHSLKIIYRGLHQSPKVSVNVAPVTALELKAGYQTFDDEFFKIKGAQLAQIEAYFRMQAEDFFFIRDLFRVDPGKDWDYRNPVWKWRQADTLLENAHRDLFGPQAVPEAVRWRNLYAAPDATQVLVPDLAKEEMFPRWKTFGKVPDPGIPEEAEVIRTGDLGFIFTSPVLRLQEGNRTLTLTLDFEEWGFEKDRLIDFFGKWPEGAPGDAKFHPPFTIEASTEAGWAAITEWNEFVIGPPEAPVSIRIELSLNEEFAPLLPVAGDPLSGSWPALKFSLNRNKIDLFDPVSNYLLDSRRPYELMRELLISGIRIGVRVEGLSTLLVQNLQGDIDPQKPFEPFGPAPKANDRLFITHPELAAQRLDSVELIPVWNNLPAVYLLEMQLRDAHRHFKLTASSGATTFELSPGKIKISVPEIPADQVFFPNDVPYARKPNPGGELPADVLSADRYLELRLLPQDRQGSPPIDGKLVETRPVEAVAGGSAKFIQLEREEARGLPIESFSVKYKVTEAVADALKAEIGNVKTAADTASANATATAQTMQNAETVAAASLAAAEAAVRTARENAERETDPAKKATATDTLNIASAIVVEEAKKAAEAALQARLAAQKAVEAVQAAATATAALDEVNHAADQVKAPGAPADLTLIAGEIPVSYFDETKKQLKVPDGIAIGRELVVSYPAPVFTEEVYTPEIDRLSVNYTASASVVLPAEERTRFADDPPLPAGAPPVSADDRLFHLHPFGYSPAESSGAWLAIAEDQEEKTVTEKKVFRFLPPYDDEGELYLGFEDLKPPQTLSLLFQLAEGSGNPDLPAGKIAWACLAGDAWQEIRGEQIGVDSTNGLQNTGIVRLNIPASASLQHTRMPAGLHWLRLRVNRYSESLNDVIAIHPQALEATWFDQGAPSDGLQRVLPPKSITDPMEPIPGLLAFLQPYSSFGGKAREQEAAFRLRVSERLRHKGRALSMWDYERLVLEQFPDIYRVKALAADLLDPGAVPGAVTLVVIPDIRFRRPFDPFEPKAPQRQLQEIRAFLQNLAPPFVRIQVQNPRFEYLHVRAAVKFYDMNNFDYYADQLQRELKQYLSPWAYDTAAEITFGRDIYLSMLIHFMETRPYVDFIDQPRLILMERLTSDGSLHPVKGTAAGPQLRDPDVILVSTPDHTLEKLDDSIDPQKRILSGIGYAKLDLDFKVAKDKPQPNS